MNLRQCDIHEQSGNVNQTALPIQERELSEKHYRALTGYNPLPLQLSIFPVNK